MKKGRMKKRVSRRRTKNADVKDTLAFKLLILSIILLILLIIVYIFVYESQVIEGELDGGLGTLKWDFGPSFDVTLVVLNYNISDDNLSIDVDLNWSAGNFSINQILIDFEGIQNYCNITLLNPLTFGVNNTQNILVGDALCNETTFENVTGVGAYAEVHINLTQTSPLPTINFYEDDSRDNIFDLSNYFSALVEINYSIFENPSNDKVAVFVNNNTKNISVGTYDTTWAGIQNFSITAESEDGDVASAIFKINFINATRPIPNEAPEFDEDCEEFEWIENTNRTVDFDNCWDDPDGDSLDYEYSDLNNYEENITIIELTGNRIKFVPKVSFIGETYLYFYANDSKIRSNERVDIIIYENTTNVTTNATNYTTPTPPSEVLEIKSSSPSSSDIHVFANTDQTFSISAENYENVEWYLNQVLVKEGVLSYIFEGVEQGNYTLEVRILNGTITESNIWRITIQRDEYIEDKIFDANMGEVIFYLIVTVLIIIIFLVIWLFVVEKNKRNKKVDLGFGISVAPRSRKNISSKQFNIPRD